MRISNREASRAFPVDECRGAARPAPGLERGRRGGGLGAAGLYGGGGKASRPPARLRLTRPIHTLPKGTHDMADMSGQVALVTGGWGVSASPSAGDCTPAASRSPPATRGVRRPPTASARSSPAPAHQGNIGVNEDCERVIGEVLEARGRLDILVNNADITIDKTVRSEDDSGRMGPSCAGQHVRRVLPV